MPHADLFNRAMEEVRRKNVVYLVTSRGRVRVLSVLQYALLEDDEVASYSVRLTFGDALDTARRRRAAS
jgi:hypothetical protein